MARRSALGLLYVGAAAGCAEVALAYATSTGGLIADARWTLFWRIAAWWVLFAIGAGALLHAPRRPALVLVLVFGVAMRLAGLAGHPVLSSDLYRYAWDGRVQAAGIDPYRYAPGEPQLVGLREHWLWPAPNRCLALSLNPGCTLINRRAVRTIYPPVAELWFRGVYAVEGVGARDRGWRGAALVVDLAVLAVMLALLRGWRRDPRWLALYAWSPIAVLETAQNGHVDGLAVLLVLLALVALRRRPGWAGSLLGAATLIKLYPALLMVLLVRRRAPAFLAAFVAFGTVVVIGYLPHVLAVGTKVLGYLPGYLREEMYTGGDRFQLIGLVGLSGTAATIAAALVVVVVLGVVVSSSVTRCEPDTAARRLLGCGLLVATPVQPWYALVLVAVAALGGAWWWLGVAAAGYPLFFTVIVSGPKYTGELSYAIALVVVLGGAVVSTSSRQRRPRLRLAEPAIHAPP